MEEVCWWLVEFGGFGSWMGVNYCKGIYVINVGKIWEKFVFVVCVFVIIENFNDVCVIFVWFYGYCVVFKYGFFIGV